MSTAAFLALAGVTRHWRHSMATLLALAFGLTGMALLNGYIAEMQRWAHALFSKRSMYGDLVISKVDSNSDDPWADFFSATDQQHIESVLVDFKPMIVARTRFLPIQGMLDARGTSLPIRGFAFDIKEGEKIRGDEWRDNTIFGRPLEGEKDSGLLVGRGLAELLGCALPEPGAGTGQNLSCLGSPLQLTGLTESGQVNLLNGELRGVIEVGMREFDDVWVMLPLTRAKDFLVTDKISMITVAVVDGSSRHQLIQALDSRLKASIPNISVLPWEEHKNNEIYRVNVAVGDLFRNFVMAIVIAVCGLSLVNTITRSVIQRTREIGTMMAIGFERRTISLIFCIEGSILGVIGSTLGIVISVLVSLAINAKGLTYVAGFLSEPTTLAIAISPLIYSKLALTLTLLSGFLAWLVASLRAKKTVVEALYHTESL